MVIVGYIMVMDCYRWLYHGYGWVIDVYLLGVDVYRWFNISWLWIGIVG